MSSRMNYAAASPELLKRYQAFTTALAAKPIMKELRHLIDLRASQINGCAFCVDMHVKEAKIDGERELRLHHLVVWRESPLFNERERAALEWTEAVTKLGPHGVPDDTYERVSAVFSEQELADITLQVVAINGWNRLAIPFQSQPGSLDKLYGLDKAGLA